MPSKFPFLLILLFAFPNAVAARTQITTGSIQGEVQDATGAVLPGVTVLVQNLDTNLQQSRQTDSNGRFVFLQLPPGRYYRVTFTLPGFGTIVQDEIALTVGQSVNARRRGWRCRNVQETVTVSGTTGVETTRAAVATTLNEPSSRRRRFSDASSRTCSR